MVIFCLLIHSSVYGHLHCFHLGLLWIMLLWISMDKFLLIYVFDHSGINRGTEFLGHMLTLYLTFWRTDKLVSIADTPVQFHQQCMRVPIPLHPCQQLLLSSFFSYSHPNGCEVVYHCSFDLKFPNDNDIEYHFMCLLTIGISCFRKCLFRLFAHF